MGRYGTVWDCFRTVLTTEGWNEREGRENRRLESKDRAEKKGYILLLVILQWPMVERENKMLVETDIISALFMKLKLYEIENDNDPEKKRFCFSPLLMKEMQIIAHCPVPNSL